MNLKFRHKVFLAFLLHSLILVVCIPLIVRFYSERNFENYIRKVEDERIIRIVDELIREYKANGNWDSVRQDSWFLFEMRRFGPPEAPGSECRVRRTFLFLLHPSREKSNRLLPWVPNLSIPGRILGVRPVLPLLAAGLMDIGPLRPSCSSTRKDAR